MGVAERKSRERGERGRRIISTARVIAATEGWNAVTIRRLAETIEYSQPVVYSHFESRDAIIAAVALEGFGELAENLRQAAARSPDRKEAMRHVALTYLTFAWEQSALYEAMFVMPICLLFAHADTEPEMRGAFAALAAVVTPSKYNVELATETFWAALHGLAELERSGRIRCGVREDRVELIINGLV